MGDLSGKVGKTGKLCKAERSQQHGKCGPMSDDLNVSVEEGRIKIFLQGRFVGEDLQLVISGGDRPHIGAVAVSFCLPSLKDAAVPAVTTSLVTVPGHKEGPLAQMAAEAIAAATGRTVSVSCGIHLESISKEEIRKVEQLVARLLDDFLTQFSVG